MNEDLSIFPGGDLVIKGLADLERRTLYAEALLVMEAGPRPIHLGFTIPELPDIPKPYSDALYSLLEEENPTQAYGNYNALIQRIVSFANSYCSVRR